MIILLFLSSCSSLRSTHLRDGDIVFQNLDCGDLCDAIESVTYGKDSLDFSHLGLIIHRGDSTYILESIGDGVCLTHLPDFLSRTHLPHYVGRLRSKYRKYIPAALEFASNQLGTAYDDEFIMNNGKYYCSELIYDAFNHSSSSSAIFTLAPMTFVSNSDPRVDSIWQNYYHDLGGSPPEKELGINPAGMSRSPALLWLKILKNH